MTNIDSLKNGLYFSRKDILEIAFRTDKSFKQSQLQRYIDTLIADNKIMRIGRNQYSYVDNGALKEYKALLSDECEKVFDVLNRKFPYLSFKLWELSWLNEFNNHLLGKNKIFVEVENDACGFVFFELENEFPSQTLIKPSTKELDYYGNNKTIIVDHLMSEVPSCGHFANLEKIIVDLFSNKILMDMISRGDYAEIIENMFTKYKINQKALFRYARRRNKEGEIKEFITINTMLKID